MISIAILGYGTVGKGVFEVFDKNKDLIKFKVGDEIKVKKILDLQDFVGDKAEKLITHNFDDILNDDEIKIVAEVMGGATFSYDCTQKLLSSGKSVVTSNKELVEKYGAELMKLAADNNVNYFYEASVGGGIPIIRNLTDCLLADDILEISGIINGTTNYMLSNMYDNNVTYDEILKDAQAKGFAEANPDADVLGYDACRKIAILTSIISNHNVNYEDIKCEGITKIDPLDIKFAKELGMKIKLIAHSNKVKDTYSAIVAPFMVNNSNPLFMVDGEFNAIFVNGNMLGESMFYGKGAGKLPTASAVSADIITCANNLGKHVSFGYSDKPINLMPSEDIKRQFFVRINTTDEQVIDLISSKLNIVKKLTIDNVTGIITDSIIEKDFISEVSNIKEVVNYIRIL